MFWKISKIYSGRPMGATGLKCNFFFFKFATKSLEKKKRGACRPPNGRQAPVAHPRGDRPVGPPGGPVAPPAGDRGGPVAPPRATGSGSLYKASPSFPPLI